MRPFSLKAPSVLPDSHEQKAQLHSRAALKAHIWALPMAGSKHCLHARLIKRVDQFQKCLIHNEETHVGFACRMVITGC
eukprot:1138957-Pelagomonas_calceolata.AAC.11